MESTAATTPVATIAIDLANEMFQLALADASFDTVRKLRLSWPEFIAFWPNRAVVHRTARINLARGMLREFGIVVPVRALRTHPKTQQ